MMKNIGRLYSFLPYSFKQQDCFIKYNYKYLFCALRKCSSQNKEHSYLDFNSNLSDEEKTAIVKNMMVLENFVSNDDEMSILNEIEPYLKKLHYEFNHWDDAIHGFRETEKQKWNIENSKILDRLRNIAFPLNCNQLQHVHVLDLSPNGYIKPHIDSTRFCGNTIAGLCLLSDAVMRLVHKDNNVNYIDVLLKRRSLYIMRDVARYDYTHEILPNSSSVFRKKTIPRTRRISVICRNEPNKNES
uniref:Alpha-ketoglutarate-dependent dioxygenase AlkB-like domain-containing protein n=1 Tax=Clastoptera arizonana TaxID=38151 RepID=A0A1B6CYI1_9HEMI